jgi:hypothetical protein
MKIERMKKAGARRSGLLIAVALSLSVPLGWNALASNKTNTGAVGSNPVKFNREPAPGQAQAAKAQGGVPDGSAQEPAIVELTGNLVALNTRYQLADRGERENLLSELRRLAAARLRRLGELIERDPAEVLRVAVPASIRAAMTPEIQELVEQRVELKGELEVLYECAERESRLLHFLEADGERLSLHFAGDPPAALLTGARVDVKGVRVGQAIALESGDGVKVSGGQRSGDTTSEATSMTNLATVQPNTFGEQKVLVILVNFQDKQTQPFSASQAHNVVFGTANSYFQEASYQQTWLSGDVYGWYTIPVSSTTCDTAAIATYAKQAATAAGVNLSAYRRYVYAFPSISCGFTGQGSVGGSPSQAWINGSMQLRTIGHELEHNLGLYHSKALECGAAVTGDSCSVVEYGDIVDILGRAGITGHSHAFQKERLGWLDYGVSPNILTVQGSGSYSLAPFESSGSGPKALKILKSVDSSGRKTWYYVEFRRPIGFDSFISSNSSVMNGVLIHQGAESNAAANYLLDMTPETSSWDDAALAVGRSYNDAAGGITISTVSVSSEGAVVNVAFGPTPCIQTNPGLTLSPSQTQWTQAGATITYTVSVRNNNSGDCADSSFNLQATVPGGWTTTFSNSIFNIASGGSAVTSMQITSPAGASDGFYDIAVRAENSSSPAYSATAHVTNVIASSIQVTVSPSQSSYAPNQVVSVSAIATVGGAPASGASLTFTVTKPNGTVVTGNSVTGGNGSAVFSYRLNKKQDPGGVYYVKVSANMNGVSGEGTTNFTVR